MRNRFLVCPSEFAGGAQQTMATWFVDDVDAMVAELASAERRCVRCAAANSHVGRLPHMNAARYDGFTRRSELLHYVLIAVEGGDDLDRARTIRAVAVAV
jgi:hypothetical protein